MFEPAGTPREAAICAAVLPLPYCFDESFFAFACAVFEPVDVHVFASWYVQFVPFAVLFAGFMPGVDEDPFVPWLGEPDCVELELELDCVDCDVESFFCCPGAFGFPPANAGAVMMLVAAANAQAAARRAEGRLISSSPCSRLA